MDNTAISRLVSKQKSFFKTNVTKHINFRLEQLKKLECLIKANESFFLEALKKDLGRCDIESFMGDFISLYKVFDTTIKSLRSWAKPQKVNSMIGTKSYIITEPLGNILIIAPWNYPVLLAIEPLIIAMAAGNCAIIKPSELTPTVTSVLANLINNNFDEGYIKVEEGGVEEATLLLSEQYDYIFFTGSTQVGKIVYEAAAKKLTPVTLELGGKSPVIIDKDIDFKTTAKRLIWGKLFNNGQTCVAPDYVYIDKRIKKDFLPILIKTINDFYGTNPQNSSCYSRIVNNANFERLKSYLKGQEIIYGGKTDESDLYIEPTILNNPSSDSPIMQNEIFGPILPIIEYTNIREAIDYINSRPKPLAMYIFSKNKRFCKEILSKTSSGGVSINDTILHITNENLPFGGVGGSGIGRYHKKAGFDAFSNKRSVLQNTILFDRNILYPPYKLTLEHIKKLAKLF